MEQEAQLSQRGRATVSVLSLGVTQGHWLSRTERISVCVEL